MRLVYAECIDALLIAEDELLYIDPASLSPADNKKRMKALQEIENAITTILRLRLVELNQAGRKTLEDIHKRTTRLREDLKRVEGVSDTIRMISSAIKFISPLLGLI
ncbi:hypothetical protein ACQKH5_13175 [Hyphomonas sp. NPDC076900]|uniref:hypothetical protein n=1 Tax=unclassified Hyphomonas TaxID=2630699 RepID=UPI003D05A5F7